METTEGKRDKIKPKRRQSWELEPEGRLFKSRTIVSLHKRHPEAESI